MTRCTLRPFLVLLFLALATYLPARAQQPVILNVSPSIQPGEALSLQGNFSSSAKAFFLAGNATTPAPLPILVQTAGQATVQIPPDTPLDRYLIWVQDQGLNSPRVNLNQAWPMHTDSPDITPGGSLRIFGRNLLLKRGTPLVRLVEGNNVLEAPVNASQSDAFTLSVQIPPTVQPGRTYTLLVTNGLGRDTYIQLEQPLTAIASGTDYFQLGVPWAAKLTFYGNVYNVKTDPRLSTKAVGNGVANDQPAIQAAIDRASADGGGVVYLPAGTYKLLYDHFEYIHMRDRVVLQGAGKDATLLKFGYQLDAQHMALYWPPVTSLAGLADLALINVDNTGNPFVGTMRGQGKEVFFQRVRFELNQGDWLWWADSQKILIANSEFTQGVDHRTNYHGPLMLNNCANFIVRDNKFTYAVDGLNLNFAHDGVFQNNQVYRDGAARYPATTVNHVLVVNFTYNLAVLNNAFKVINGPTQNRNDGETIISEGGGADRIDEETGTVSWAGGTSLRDERKNWGPYRLNPVVAIVSGKGMGQWRRITGRSGNTLSLDRAWEVAPEAGSRYTIFNWGSRNWLVQGNYMEGNRRGITLYHNATTQVALVKNTLVNSGSIDLTPIQVDNGGQKFIPMYTNQIINNSVSNTDGSNGVFIGVHTVQAIQERTFGTSVVGLEVRDNNLLTALPNIPAVVDAPFPEGYLNYLQFQPLNKTYVDENIPAILGSVFQNNTAANCDNALYVNSGSHNTLVCGMGLQNTTNLLKDDRLDGTSQTSIGTTFCLNNPISTPRTDIRIYPNPASTELHVRLSTIGARFMVYSMAGVLVIDTRSATNTIDLDVKSLPTGAYVLLVESDEGGRMSQTFIKHRL
ncbi:glycosyl hydrolase family 28-related protein [Spirosoma lituiforme]